MDDDPLINRAASRDGRQSRKDRLRNEHAGPWATSSQDFVGLARDLLERSAESAAKCENASPYTLAGIPMLFSALRCLLIELNSGMFDFQVRAERLKALAESGVEWKIVVDNYAVPAELAERLRLLWEVRNEIIHPSHRPGPETSGTPGYLSTLKDAGLLQSTGRGSDYVWLSQLQSHRLFVWAFETVGAVVDLLIEQHGIEGIPARGLRASYAVEPDDRWWMRNP